MRCLPQVHRREVPGAREHCPGASVCIKAQSTPASAKAFSAFRRRRSARRDAGFTIRSTRSSRLGANRIAVAALMAWTPGPVRAPWLIESAELSTWPPALVQLQAPEDEIRLPVANVENARVLGAGIEPAWEFFPRDFKSLASTDFATRAGTKQPARCRLRASAAATFIPRPRNHTDPEEKTKRETGLEPATPTLARLCSTN